MGCPWILLLPRGTLRSNTLKRHLLYFRIRWQLARSWSTNYLNPPFSSLVRTLTGSGTEQQRLSALRHLDRNLFHHSESGQREAGNYQEETQLLGLIGCHGFRPDLQENEATSCSRSLPRSRARQACVQGRFFVLFSAHRVLQLFGLTELLR